MPVVLPDGAVSGKNVTVAYPSLLMEDKKLREARDRIRPGSQYPSARAP